MSIASRILGPILLLVLIGLGGAASITIDAVRTHDQIQAEEHRAYDLLETLDRTQVALNALRAFVSDVLRFDIVLSPQIIAKEYRVKRDALEREVTQLEAVVAQSGTRIATEDLDAAVDFWRSRAEVALGIERDADVPTALHVSQLADRATMVLATLSQSARVAADARLEKTRGAFEARAIAIFLIMSVLSSSLGVMFLILGRRLASVMRTLAETMELVRLGRFSASVEGLDRGDEIGQIARGVRAFGWTLEALTSAKARIEHLANHDQLTDLPNRRALKDHLTGLLFDRSGSRTPFFVLHVDLDRFKHVNDLYGHEAGDEVLKHAARAMRLAVREPDIVARVGGDEFVIVVNQLPDGQPIESLARRIIDVVSEPVEMRGELTRVGASIGIVSSACGECDGERLLGNADIALYAAKGAGRGCHAFYSEATRLQFEQDLSVIKDLRAGLDRGEVVAFFQPQLDMSRDEVIGFEALARWRHPTRGLLGPGEFVDLAFRNGLGDRISDAIVEHAIDAILSWRAEGHGKICVSVNFAAMQLRDGGLVERLDDALLMSGLEPKDLVIEVLESVLLGDEVDPAVATIARLKKRGYKVELDDFGSGHASVSNLRKFAVDGVKLDRIFVSGIDQDPEQQVIARTLVELCQNLGIECLAEGAETPGEIACLRQMGCDRFQGYAIAMPMSKDEVSKWMSRRPSRSSLRVIAGGE